MLFGNLEVVASSPAAVVVAAAKPPLGRRAWMLSTRPWSWQVSPCSRRRTSNSPQVVSAPSRNCALLMEFAASAFFQALLGSSFQHPQRWPLGVSQSLLGTQCLGFWGSPPSLRRRICSRTKPLLLLLDVGGASVSAEVEEPQTQKPSGSPRLPLLPARDAAWAAAAERSSSTSSWILRHFWSASWRTLASSSRSSASFASSVGVLPKTDVRRGPQGEAAEVPVSWQACAPKIVVMEQRLPKLLERRPSIFFAWAVELLLWLLLSI